MASWRQTAGAPLSVARGRTRQGSHTARLLHPRSGPPSECLCVKWTEAEPRGQPVARYEVHATVVAVGVHLVSCESDAVESGQPASGRVTSRKHGKKSRDSPSESSMCRKVLVNLDDPAVSDSSLGASPLLADSGLSAEGIWAILEGGGLQAVDVCSSAMDKLNVKPTRGVDHAKLSDAHKGDVAAAKGDLPLHASVGSSFVLWQGGACEVVLRGIPAFRRLGASSIALRVAAVGVDGQRSQLSQHWIADLCNKQVLACPAGHVGPEEDSTAGAAEEDGSLGIRKRGQGSSNRASTAEENTMSAAERK